MQKKQKKTVVGSFVVACKLCYPRHKFSYDLPSLPEEGIRYLPKLIAVAGGSLPSTRGEFSTSEKVGKFLICIAVFRIIDTANTEIKEAFAAAASSVDWETQFCL